MATPVSKFNPAISDTLFNIYTVFSLTRLITSALHSIFFTAVCSDSHSSLHKFANISAHSVSLHLQFFSLSLSHTHTKIKKIKIQKNNMAEGLLLCGVEFLTIPSAHTHQII